MICQVSRIGAIIMNEVQLINIDNWNVVLCDFRPKDLSKQPELSNVTDGADHEPSECKRLKFNE